MTACTEVKCMSHVWWNIEVSLAVDVSCSLKEELVIIFQVMFSPFRGLQIVWNSEPVAIFKFQTATGRDIVPGNSFYLKLASM